MKRTLLLLLLPFLLTSCSNPDTSGGVTLSKGADDANEFPHGDCAGQGKNPPDGDSGCGWITINEKSYYIYPGIYLNDADLTGANLRGANLRDATIEQGTLLTNADLTGVDLSDAYIKDVSFIGANLTGARIGDGQLVFNLAVWCTTICPNGIHWGVKSNNCAEFQIGPKPRFGTTEINCACDPTQC